MPDLAVVICAHHKPWLGMGTILSLAAQRDVSYDLHVCYNVGDGASVRRPAYAAYYALAKQWGINPQLSPFDPRIRDVFRISGIRVVEHEFENDHSLDSGAWYKFLQTDAWKSYDRVLFLGEGTLFTRPSALSCLVRFAHRRPKAVIASGHEKQRLPKSLFLSYNTRELNPSPYQRYHDEMIGQAFQIFQRDAAFDRLFQAWGEVPPETQDHTPDIWPRSRLAARLWHRANVKLEDPTTKAVRLILRRWYYWRTLGRAQGWLPPRNEPTNPRVHVNTRLQPLDEVVRTQLEGAVRFHEEEGPEWFGCATNHLMPGDFLRDFVSRLNRHRMWDVLDLPFSGTSLEVLWGFFPAWLGYEKWFTDGIHRPRKSFATYRREDDAHGMANYVNQYFLGDLCVTPDHDFVRLRSMSRPLRRLRTALPRVYFEGSAA